MESEYKTAHKLSNGTSFNNLEWPLTYISRSRGYYYALDVLRAELTRDLFAIAKLLLFDILDSFA